MTLKTYLKTYLKEVQGNVIFIGVKDTSLTSIMEKSDNISQCYFLNSETLSTTERIKRRFSFRSKGNIPITKFRKTFKKKKIDFILCSSEEINSSLPIFIKDSIYICKGTIYYFGNKDDKALEIIRNKYRRYKVKISEEVFKNETLIKIEVGKAKTFKIKEFIFKIKDGIAFIIDLLSDFLIG